MHIHAHAASQRKYADAASHRGERKDRPVSRNAMVGMINSLKKAVGNQQWEPAPSAWRDYYAAKQSYSDEALQHKEELVSKAVADAAPATVWDLGGNTGRFSRIAAKAGADVVTLEMDPSAVELNWREVVENNETSILPLVCDLSNPTPSQGWAHRERPSLTERGPAAMGLALALVHHIAIGGNVPLGDIAQWFALLCERVVIEWVPKEDPMVQRLLASREDVFTEYHQEGFEAALEPFFTVDSREAVRSSVRTMYVLTRRGE